MKRYLFILLAILFTLSSCSDDDKNEKNNKTFKENRVYTFLNFESEEACEEINANVEVSVNCYAFIKFKKDGTLTYLLTDILYAGTYVIENDKITVDLEDTAIAETGKTTLSFRVIDDNKLEAEDQSVWNRSSDETE